MSRDVSEYLNDIVECCEKVIRYASGMSAEDIAADDKTFDAIVRNLEIIGEAVRHVPPDLRARYPQIPWSRISGFRNIATHAYSTVDEDMVFDFIVNKVPELLVEINALIDTEYSDVKPPYS